MDPDVITRRLLATGDGLAHRRDLVAAGVHRNWIAKELAAGRLFQPLPGVLSRLDDSENVTRRFRAALLYAGGNAALTHRSALALWQVTRPPRPWEPVHLAVLQGSLPRSRSTWQVVVRQRRRRPTTYRAGLPVVPVSEALQALATDTAMNDVRLLAFEALQSGLLTPADLVAGCPRRSVTVMKHVAEEALAGARSGGEATYWRLIKDAGLPLPELNAWCRTSEGAYLVDALWARLGLGVEIDGRSVHVQAEVFEADRERQNHLHISGVLLIRFPVSMVFQNPAVVVRQTEHALRARAAELRIPWR